MRVIKIPRKNIHDFVSSFFSRKDGEFVMWLMGKDKDSKENCIFAGCGTKEEVKTWVEQIMTEKAQQNLVK